MNSQLRPEVMAARSFSRSFPTSNAQARKLTPAVVLADPGVYSPPEILTHYALFPASFPDATSTQSIGKSWDTLSAT